MSVGTLNIGLARLVKLTHIMERALKREVSSRNLLLLRLVQLLILLPLLLKPLLLQHLLVHLVHLLAGLLHALLLHLRKQVKERNQGGKPTCVSDFGVLFFLVTGRESSLWKIFENNENKSLKKNICTCRLMLSWSNAVFAGWCSPGWPRTTPMHVWQMPMNIIKSYKQEKFVSIHKIWIICFW